MPKRLYMPQNFETTACSTKGRNEVGKGVTIRRVPKSPNNVTSTFFNTAHLLSKNLMFEHKGAKLASCPGRHLTSLRPWQHGSQSSPNPRTHGKAATIASYRVFHVLGKHNEPFEGSDILKEAFLEATNSLLENFNNKTDRESQKEVQLSRNASTKQCEGIATYVEEQLRKDFETWECFPLQFGVMTDRWMWNNCVFSSGWVLKTWVPRKSYSPLSIKRTHQMWDWEFFNAFCGTC